jgi:hypothetical protein
MVMRAIFCLLLLPVFFLMSSCREAGTPAPGTPVPRPIMGKGGSSESDRDFLGLSEAAGASLAERRGLRHRVVSVDGEMRPATRDYRIDRVSFDLEGGRIVKVSRG